LIGPYAVLSTLAATDVRNFLVGEILDIHVPFCIFNSHTDELPISIEFNQNILFDISCFGNFFMREIYEQGIRVREVLHLHHESSLNLRSKNALCIVSLSSRRITRRYLSSASGIFAHLYLQAIRRSLHHGRIQDTIAQVGKDGGARLL